MSELKPVSLLKTIRQFAAVLWQAVSYKLVYALLLTITRSFAEGLGLLMLMPALHIAGVDSSSSSFGRVDETLRAFLDPLGLHPTLGLVLIGSAVLVVAIRMLSRAQQVVTIVVQQGFERFLRQNLYEAIAASNWLFFSSRKNSDLIHAFTTQIDMLGLASYMLLTLVGEMVITAAYVIVAVKLSGIATALILACGGVVFVSFGGRFRALIETGDEVNRANAFYHSTTSQHLAGMKIAKAYGAGARGSEAFDRTTSEVEKAFVSTTQKQTAIQLWFDISSYLVLLAALYFSLGMLRVGVPATLVMLFVFMRLMPKLSSIQIRSAQLTSTIPIFRDFSHLLDRCREAAEPATIASSALEFQHQLTLEDVTFTYPRQRIGAVREVNIAVSAGQFVAVVGSSGAGKSTIADLLLGLLTPDKGRIAIDGIALTPQRLRSWRDQIGYVPQDTFLFHDTIRENLLWAAPDATDAEIAHSLKVAAVDECLARLPDGIETIVGDRGVLLSGGERQRIALARALLRAPSVLILDEATSSLDSENEARILDAIEQLRGSVTILVITHRLSSVRNADMIYVLETGQVVESGSWSSLLSRPTTRLAQLAAAQHIDVTRPSRKFRIV